jgi:hypothetical protein
MLSPICAAAAGSGTSQRGRGVREGRKKERRMKERTILDKGTEQLEAR